MEKLNSFEEYKCLVNDVRTQVKRPFSNNYFLPQDIQRYIQLNRAYYQNTDNGIVFLFDEELYYRACLYMDASQPFELPNLDKKILIRNVYRAEKKESEMFLVERQLEKINFKMMGTTVQLRGEAEVIFEKYKKFERFIKTMDKKGYRCYVAGESHFEKVEELLRQEKIIKDYHMDFLLPEEKEEGAYLYLLDSKGEMCAASAATIKGSTAHGVGIAIDERYKLQGLAPILGYYRMKWLCDNGIKYIQGWALIDNEESLRYHISSGYKMLDKYADEWIKEND